MTATLPGALPLQRPAAGAADPLATAEALAALLPRLERLHGRTLVVKYGGHAMADQAASAAFAQDVALLRYCGLRVVVVHGGGPQIDAQLRVQGIESAFHAGYRVTTPETMHVVRMVLMGQVNRDVVNAINAHGPLAVGCSGEDGRLLAASRRVASVDGHLVDLGLVGDVVRVEPAVLTALLDAGRVPVVATIARGLDGETYNVNADAAAAALAVALGADGLVVLTDVPGVYADWPACAELIDHLDADRLRALLPGLSAGMVPKMEACLHAVEGGVPRAHVVDGRAPHSLLIEVLTGDGAGTTVTLEGAA
ncbi:MAG: acetylglutamate kinase [Frankiaceae bacterium]